MATRKTASKTPKAAPKAAPKQDSAVEALEKRVVELEKKLSAEPSSADTTARAEITRLNTLLQRVCEAITESPSMFVLQKKLTRILR